MNIFMTKMAIAKNIFGIYKNLIKIIKAQFFQNCSKLSKIIKKDRVDNGKSKIKN